MTAYSLEVVALCSWSLVTLILLTEFKFFTSFILAFVKCALPYIYFSDVLGDNWTWNLKDDLGYMEAAKFLLSKDTDPLGLILFDSERRHLFSIAGGHHVLFQWLNYASFYYLSPKYFAPVYINIALTAVATVLFMRVLKIADYSYRSVIQIGALSCVGLELLSWSSFLNLKEPVVILLTTAALYFMVGFNKYKKLRHLVGFGLVCLLFYYLRFYLPVLFVIAYLLAVFPWSSLAPVVLLTFTTVATLASQIGVNQIDRFHFDNFAFNALRFLLSPRPWGIEASYSFLLLTSVFHLALVPLAFVGFTLTSKKGFAGRLFASYVVILVIFYALLPDFNGPRHRHQMYFVMALFQISGAAWAIRLLSAGPSRTSEFHEVTAR